MSRVSHIERVWEISDDDYSFYLGRIWRLDCVSYLKCTAVLYSEGQLVRIWKPDFDMEQMSVRQALEPEEAGQCDDFGIQCLTC